MMRSLWISKTGMEAQQHQLDSISHNLANTGTTGYKRARALFEDLMYQNLRQAGANSSDQTQLPIGLQLGLGVKTSGVARNFSQGSIQETGNPFDVAILGNGFFQIQLPDGSTGYSRDGAFKLNSQGQLVTNQGYAVLPGITIPANASVTIARDGTVSVVSPGAAAPSTVGQLQLASFVNAAGLDPRGENLFLESAASGQPATGAPDSTGLGSLGQRQLEGSNVNVVEELVSMIQTQRAYEINSKAIQAADQMLQRLSQLG